MYMYFPSSHPHTSPSHHHTHTPHPPIITPTHLTLPLSHPHTPPSHHHTHTPHPPIITPTHITLPPSQAHHYHHLPISHPFTHNSRTSTELSMKVLASWRALFVVVWMFCRLLNTCWLLRNEKMTPTASPQVRRTRIMVNTHMRQSLYLVSFCFRLPPQNPHSRQQQKQQPHTGMQIPIRPPITVRAMRPAKYNPSYNKNNILYTYPIYPHVWRCELRIVDPDYVWPSSRPYRRQILSLATRQHYWLHSTSWDHSSVCKRLVECSMRYQRAGFFVWILFS